jgi:hypothetical protein
MKRKAAAADEAEPLAAEGPSSKRTRAEPPAPAAAEGSDASLATEDRIGDEAGVVVHV